MSNRNFINPVPGRRREPAFPAWTLLLIMAAFPACSAFPQLVRHSDPLSPEQHMQLGASYEAQGLTDDALRQYEAALDLDKKYIPALIATGNLDFASGDLKKAEASYRRVLRLERNHAGANNNLAMVALSRGNDLEKAEQYAQKALDQGGPLRPYVMETLASIFVRQGRFDDARKILDEADTLTSSDDKALREQIEKTREKLLLSQR